MESHVPSAVHKVVARFQIFADGTLTLLNLGGYKPKIAASHTACIPGLTRHSYHNIKNIHTTSLFTVYFAIYTQYVQSRHRENDL